MQKINFFGIPLEVYRGKGHDKAWFDLIPFSSEGVEVEGYGAFRKHSVYFHLEVNGTTYMGEIKY